MITGSIVRNATPVVHCARHSPWLHRSLPPHAELQAPQCEALVCTLTHAPPHDVTQPVEQMPLVPQTPRSSGLVALQTAQVAPQPRV